MIISLIEIIPFLQNSPNLTSFYSIIPTIRHSVNHSFTTKNMTLKRRLSIYISAAFSILFGIGITVVYLSFAAFRKEEFSDRLEEKALTTVELLLNVKEIDKQMLKVIDQNSINKLYNEKTLVFDENYRLIYSSIDDASIRWNRQDLIRLKESKRFFKIEGDKELLGIFYDFKEADYYVLIAAEDLYGNSKLQYLFYSLLVMFLVGTALVWTKSWTFRPTNSTPSSPSVRAATTRLRC